LQNYLIQNIDRTYDFPAEGVNNYFNILLNQLTGEIQNLIWVLIRFSTYSINELSTTVTHLFNNRSLTKERINQNLAISVRSFDLIEMINVNVDLVARNLYPRLNRIYKNMITQNKQQNDNMKIFFKEIIQIRKFLMHKDKKTVIFNNYISKFIMNTQE
jgi:hypothetical protein